MNTAISACNQLGLQKNLMKVNSSMNLFFGAGISILCPFLQKTLLYVEHQKQFWSNHFLKKLETNTYKN